MSIFENNSYLYRKKITLLSAFALIVVLFGYLFTSKVNATTTIESSFVNAANTVREFCNSSDLVDEVVGRFSITRSIQGDTDDDGGESYGMNFETLSNTAVIIANGLIVIYLSIYIIREAMRGDPSMDFWFKVFAVMMVTCVLVSNWGRIISTIENTGWRLIANMANNTTDDNWDEEVDADELLDSIENRSDQTDLTDEDSRRVQLLRACAITPAEILREKGMISDIPDGIEDATWTYWETGDASEAIELLSDYFLDDRYDTGILLAITLGVFSLLRVGFLCAIDAQVFFIALQLILRKAMAPIAVVDVAMGGTRGSGVRYLKRYFALYVQMAICVVIAMAFMGIITNALESNAVQNANYVVKLYYIMACMGAMIAAVSQSGSLAQELIGD